MGEYLLHMQPVVFTYGFRAWVALLFAAGSALCFAGLLGGGLAELLCNCDILRRNRLYAPRSSKDVLDSIGALGILTSILAYVAWGAALNIRLLSDVRLDDRGVTWLVLGKFLKRQIAWDEVASIRIYQTKDAAVLPVGSYRLYSLQRTAGKKSRFAYGQRNGPIVVTDKICGIEELRYAINEQVRKRGIPVLDCRESAEGEAVPTV